MNTEGNKALEAEAECCESFQVHSDMVEAVRCHMPEDELLDSISDTFKVFGDKTRIKILYVLHTCELCVCDIAQLLDMNQSAISHQLRVLLVELCKSLKELFCRFRFANVAAKIRTFILNFQIIPELFFLKVCFIILYRRSLSNAGAKVVL